MSGIVRIEMPIKELPEDFDVNSSGEIARSSRVFLNGHDVSPVVQAWHINRIPNSDHAFVTLRLAGKIEFEQIERSGTDE